MLNGILVVANLEDKDSHVLCVVSKKETFLVPLIRTSGISSAFIDPDKFDDIQYQKIADIVECMNKEKLFSMFKYTPKSKVAPEFDKNITGFMKPNGVKLVMPEGIEKILTDNGYTVVAKSVGKSPYTRRDYGKQVAENPDFKMQYDVEMNKIQNAKASFEKLPVDVKMSYECIEAGSRDGALFLGPTGTGKTWMSMILACKAGAHREDYQITPDTQVEDLEGKFVPDDTPGSQNKWRFEEGPLLKSFHMGYVCSIQEINYGQAGVNSCLNKYLDGTAQVTVNGKTYHRHPNFVCYLTANPGYEGTEELNQALKNRFSIIQVPALTKEEYTERLQTYSEYLGHKLSKEFFGELFEFANVIEQRGATSQWHEKNKFSIRNAQRLCDAILLKQRSFEEFSAEIATQYLNALSCDNDNSEKLIKFKKEEEVVNSIKKLYDLYDFSEAETAKVVDSFDDLFVEEEATGEDAKGEGSGKMVDDLLKRFGL